MAKKQGRRSVWAGLAMALVLAAGFPGLTLAAGGPPNGRGNGQSGGTGVIGTLTAEQEAALVEALEEEYGALALYESVMEDFGEVQPFAAIAASEASHVAALVNLFERYGIAAPAAPAFTPPTFETLEEACAAGVTAEIVDGALYDQLAPLFDQENVLRVFSNLQSASLNSHLPAFEACVDGEAPTGSAGEALMSNGARGAAPISGARDTPGMRNAQDLAGMETSDGDCEPALNAAGGENGLQRFAQQLQKAAETFFQRMFRGG
ncbi:MAG: DUF2202 domain-containing protein [Anaerolineae bacterium]|nr:DUF2202 domain-containing protein [Anaerolineae bacterium]